MTPASLADQIERARQAQLRQVDERRAAGICEDCGDPDGVVPAWDYEARPPVVRSRCGRCRAKAARAARGTADQSDDTSA